MNEKILQQIAQILKKRPFRINDDVDYASKIKMFSKWDSLKHLMFLMEVEKKFKIEILPAEIKSIIHIKDIIKKINRDGNRRTKRGASKK